MSRSEKTYINDVETLRHRFRLSKLGFSWQIGPDDGPVVRLIPSMIHLTDNDAPVGESPFLIAFKQLICDRIGEIRHCIGTTLTADGELTLSQHLDSYMLGIHYHYSETPQNDGSSEGGCVMEASISQFFASQQISG